jgi:hypothetical protein
MQSPPTQQMNNYIYNTNVLNQKPFRVSHDHGVEHIAIFVLRRFGIATELRVVLLLLVTQGLLGVITLAYFHLY